MRGKLALAFAVSTCVLCLALVGCGGGAASSSAASSSSASSAAASASSSSAAQASSSASSSSDSHDSYFVGTWDLYESDEATHEQVVQTMEQYANDPDTRAKMNEAYGRDDEIEFCARFAADGTGEMDTGAEIVSFTWEATNEGAVTFTSFGGKETAIHVPVTDGKFTLNGDTYAKAN